MLEDHHLLARGVILFSIGIITGQYERDTTCHDLYEAALRKAHVDIIDPIRLSARLSEKIATRISAGTMKSYDAMIVRGLNFIGDTDFQFEIFERLSSNGVMLINSPTAIQLAESKFLTGDILRENKCPIPETLFVQTLDNAIDFLREFKDVVVKPVYGFQGYGVIRVKENEADAAERIGTLLDEYHCVCLQPYIQNPGRDIRAFVVGNRVVSAIYRFAGSGEWKTSIRTGGIPKTCFLTPKQQDMAVAASCCLGLDYTGVDIIEGPDADYILEVNGAPAWGGILEATGRNVAEDIIRYIIEKLEGGDS